MRTHNSVWKEKGRADLQNAVHGGALGAAATRSHGGRSRQHCGIGHRLGLLSVHHHAAAAGIAHGGAEHEGALRHRCQRLPVPQLLWAAAAARYLSAQQTPVHRERSHSHDVDFCYRLDLWNDETST